MTNNRVSVLISALQEYLADIMYSIDYGYTASILSKRYEGTCSTSPSINFRSPHNVGLLEFYNSKKQTNTPSRFRTCYLVICTAGGCNNHHDYPAFTAHMHLDIQHLPAVDIIYDYTWLYIRAYICK